MWGKSYLIYSPPSSAAKAPICTGPCFIWISKPVRRWSDTLNDIFWASLEECDCLSALDRGTWSLTQCILCAIGVTVISIYLHSLLCGWDGCRSLFASQSAPHNSDGIWEIVHIFARETVAPRWRAGFRRDLIVFIMLHSPSTASPAIEEAHKRVPAEFSVTLKACA